MKRVNIKCPYCSSQAHLRPAAVIYGSHTEDPTAKVYVCAHYPACDSYVAAHRATLLPISTVSIPRSVPRTWSMRNGSVKN